LSRDTALAKGPLAFRTISEASEELGVPAQVLRFWESRFSFIRPMKRAGGRRFYRPQDIAVLQGVRTLLHDDGYTIKGVQKLHKEQGVRRLLEASHGGPAPLAVVSEGVVAAPPSDDRRSRLTVALDDLLAVKARLDSLLGQDK
jgi:DNA-binding transcriptional MerR regulator